MKTIGNRLALAAACACAVLVPQTTAQVADRPAKAGWADARAMGPFVVRADFTLADHEATIRDLAGLQPALVRLLGIQPAKEPIEVYLFHDKAAYTRYLSRYLPNVPYRRAIYVKGRGPGRVFAHWGPDFEVDLRHECTHALLHASLPLVPLWLDEGLAQCFEAGDPRPVDRPQLKGVRESLRNGTLSPIETLEAKTSLAEMGEREYRDSWAWVHFMLAGPREAGEELRAYLADIQHGTPPGRLSNRLRRRVPKVEQQLAAHFSG